MGQQLVRDAFDLSLEPFDLGVNLAKGRRTPADVPPAALRRTSSFRAPKTRMVPHDIAKAVTGGANLPCSRTLATSLG